MADTAADILVENILDWGVDTVFGLPGDGINGIMEALRTRQDRVRFIQVRHEETAALMAVGHAKYTGGPGVCVSTQGPGAVHLLNGLYDAKLDQAPVLAITGMPYHDLIGTRTQQDVELDKVFVDVAEYKRRQAPPGVKIGARSMIAAGALVTPGTEIPEGVLVIGAPAKVKGPLAGTPAEEWVKRNPQGYQALAQRHKAGVIGI